MIVMDGGQGAFIAYLNALFQCTVFPKEIQILIGKVDLDQFDLFVQTGLF
jgi:hypothetical protein